MTTRHIVALGGGGFSTGPESRALDDFILGLARQEAPRVCFLPTAGGDQEAAVARFYQAFPKQRCQSTHLPLFRRWVRDLDEFLLRQHVVYVGGGNTANMLAVWRVHGLDRALRRAWEAGVVMAGVSAGAICWFEAGITDSFGPLLAPLHNGLGLLRGSVCPHYDGEPQRRPAYRKAVVEGLPGGFAVDDAVGLHFEGTELAEAVAAKAGGRALRVELGEGGVTETPLPVRVLG